MGTPLFPNFPRLRFRRWAARLALLAVLLQAAAAGFHTPVAQALVPHQAADCAAGEGDGSHPAPAHTPQVHLQHCPFCLVLQGGNLLPPAVCLVFPPTGVAVRIGLPPPPVLAGSAFPPAPQPRGPPASA